jgi:hypothetical protein
MLDRGIYIVPDNKHTSAYRRRKLCTALLADCPVNRARDSGIVLCSKQARFQGDDQQPKEKKLESERYELSVSSQLTFWNSQDE